MSRSSSCALLGTGIQTDLQTRRHLPHLWRVGMVGESELGPAGPGMWFDMWFCPESQEMDAEDRSPEEVIQRHGRR